MLSELFYGTNKHTYPPFKNGKYMEEYFLQYIKEHEITLKKTYIPVLWTNFQIEGWFVKKKSIMQNELNKYVNAQDTQEFFTVIQYDDGALLTLPPNTTVYGACSGTIPLPLIYEDINNTLIRAPRKTFMEKEFLCSFVGSVTHNVRTKIHNMYKHDANFYFSNNKSWTPSVDVQKQNNFIDTTVNSKFALAPRGYGRSSFRFFEIFKLGTIPIYVWDDIEWLPYMDKLDYSKFCISINIKDIATLGHVIKNITEEQYNKMINEYEQIKHMFELDYMCSYIIDNVNDD